MFKVERGAAGEKIAYVRMFSGTVRARDRLRFGQAPELADLARRDRFPRYRGTSLEDRDGGYLAVSLGVGAGAEP